MTWSYQTPDTTLTAMLATEYTIGSTLMDDTTPSIPDPTPDTSSFDFGGGGGFSGGGGGSDF